MTTQDLIHEIQSKNPQITEEQILEKLQAEKMRTGGLLGDETLLRLIAAKYGVEVSQNSLHNSGALPISRLFPGLYDVTVAGRLIAVFPAKTFQTADKSGKFATVMLADNDGILRVVLWDEKANLVETGSLKPKQAVRLLHGYTKEDRYGKTELHLGSKSQIEVEAPEKTGTYPPIERFIEKIGGLKAASGNVHIFGTVKTVLGKSSFVRSDQTEGEVMRLTMADDSGSVAVVAWNEKAVELQSARVSTRILLINARVKEAQNGMVEVHVDSNTFIDLQQ